MANHPQHVNPHQLAANNTQSYGASTSAASSSTLGSVGVLQPHQQHGQHQQHPHPQQQQQVQHQQQDAPVNPNAGIAPHDTTHRPTAPGGVAYQHKSSISYHPVASGSGSGSSAMPPPPTPTLTPHSNAVGAGGATVVAKGDWTKDLVRLAKLAELKKYALQLQLHTAHICSAHASIEQKMKMVQDVREQKNKLDSERTRLLNCLREINEDRDKADLAEASLDRECTELRNQANFITDGEYARTKAEVDRLRAEVGQEPLPGIQATLDSKTAQYLNERRLNATTPSSSAPGNTKSGSTSKKRSAAQAELGGGGGSGSSPAAGEAKRSRGRPKGSKNRPKSGE